MPQRRREEEIIRTIREHLRGAVRSFQAITDEQLMKSAGCARKTFYKYVTKGSQIEGEIQTARIKQKKYVESVKRGSNSVGGDNLRKRLERAEEGNRELLAMITRTTANLIIRYGVSIETIQAAQQDALPHPNRSQSHAGKRRRRK
jgi:hypothetical protein